MLVGDVKAICSPLKLTHRKYWEVFYIRCRIGVHYYYMQVHWPRQPGCVLCPLSLGATDAQWSSVLCANGCANKPLAFLLPITWREIQHLQRTAPQQIAATKFAVKYVMIINIMFVSLMAPSLLLFIISMGFWSQGFTLPELFWGLVTSSQPPIALLKSLITPLCSSFYRQPLLKVL